MKKGDIVTYLDAKAKIIRVSTRGTVTIELLEDTPKPHPYRKRDQIVLHNWELK